MRNINFRKAQKIDNENEYRRILKESDKILAEGGIKALSDSIKKMFLPYEERRTDELGITN